MKLRNTLAQIVTTTGVVIALGLPGGSTVAGASFQGLGNLGLNSSASAISADGSTVVGSALTVSGDEVFTRAFAWTRSGGMRGLGMLEGSIYSEATDVSRDGSIVVGSYKTVSYDQQACMWTAAGDIIGLGHVGGYGSKPETSRACAVSEDGKVVVGEYLEAGPIAFRWDEVNGMVSLGDFPGGLRQSSADDVSSDGLVVVGYGISGSTVNRYGNLQAFRWTGAEGMIGLGDLPGGQTLSTAGAVSSDGIVIVGTSSSSDDVWESEAFLWTQGAGMLALGDLAGGLKFSGANAVSADGTVIVGYGTTDSSQEAVVWDSIQGMRAVSDILIGTGLDLSGWTLYEATDVSADGTVVVGNGINRQGNHEAWIAVLADEEPPVIVEATASPAMLWPPNHRMVPVQVDALVQDNSGEATWKVISVRSNDPKSDANDVRILSDTRIALRASRSRHGAARVYTIRLQAEDAAGNRSEVKSVQVTVPHHAR